MKPWIWLRLAAVLQGIGSVLHTIATTVRPNHGPAEEALFAAMQSFHFQIMGATRSHWDFYRGYELSITVVFGIIAVLIWQLGTLSRAEPRQAMPLIVTMLIAQILLDVVSWEYFFAGPGTMSVLIAACLAASLLGLRKSDQPAFATSRAAKAG
ncbi:MAG: LIC_13387 family protein [Candidatus Binatus sp.]